MGRGEEASRPSWRAAWDPSWRERLVSARGEATRQAGTRPPSRRSPHRRAAAAWLAAEPAVREDFNGFFSSWDPA